MSMAAANTKSGVRIRTATLVPAPSKASSKVQGPLGSLSLKIRIIYIYRVRIDELNGCVNIYTEKIDFCDSRSLPIWFLVSSLSISCTVF